MPFHIEFAKVLWDYNQLNQAPLDADMLLVMGTNDLNVPEYAAQLYQQYSYKYVIVTGGVPHTQSLHGKAFEGTEAEMFFKTLVHLGVPDDVIFLENDAKNTGENITFSQGLLRTKNLKITSGQLVHTPAMERRALATAEKQWPIYQMVRNFTKY